MYYFTVYSHDWTVYILNTNFWCKFGPCLVCMSKLLGIDPGYNFVCTWKQCLVWGSMLTDFEHMGQTKKGWRFFWFIDSYIRDQEIKPNYPKSTFQCILRLALGNLV